MLIPEMCMQYTEVFKTLKLELALIGCFGIAIGYWLRGKE
jgi:hypothetical protein